MHGRDAPADTDEEVRRAAPVLTIDYALYEDYLEGSGLDEAQKREFLDALWSIVVEFVLLGFAVHPAQTAQRACGKPGRQRPAPPPAALHSGDKGTSTFEKAAGAQARRAAERLSP